MNNLVIFASGGGTNFINILKNTQNNKIKDCRISLLVSNNSNSNSVLYASEHKIDTFIINQKRYPDKEKYIKVLINKISEHSPSLVVLAGYMKLIPKEMISKFKNKIINIHPGKLPEFGGKGYYGMNVHRAVIDSGAKTTAVTVHHVNEEYDRGMIIYQEIIDVRKDDSPETLSERVLKYEHKIYSDVINNIINGKD